MESGDKGGKKLEGYRIASCWLVTDKIDTDRTPDWWEIAADLSAVTETDFLSGSVQ